MNEAKQKAKELVCEKCNINSVGARFLGKDICNECYDKIGNALNSIR